MTLKTPSRALGLLAAAFALSVPGAEAQTPATAPAPISKANWPADVDRQSGFRLPLPKREDLDENGREAYGVESAVDGRGPRRVTQCGSFLAATSHRP